MVLTTPDGMISIIIIHVHSTVVKTSLSGFDITAMAVVRVGCEYD